MTRGFFTAPIFQRLRRRDFITLNLFQGLLYLMISPVVNNIQEGIATTNESWAQYGRDILCIMGLYCIISAAINALKKTKPSINEFYATVLVIGACLIYEYIRNFAISSSSWFPKLLLVCAGGSLDSFDLCDVGCYTLGTIAAPIVSCASAIITNELRYIGSLMRDYCYSRKYIGY
jgi:hypothetical protein